MATFLIEVTYTAQGAHGLQAEGGTRRRAAVQQLIEGSGGRVQSFHFALGKADAYLIVELPDARTATALSVAVGASGAARLRTVPLLTPEEMDAALKLPVTYRAPGADAR